MNITLNHYFQLCEVQLINAPGRWEEKATKICEETFSLLRGSNRELSSTQEQVTLLGPRLQRWMGWPLWKADLCAQEISRKWRKTLSLQYHGEEAIDEAMALKVLIQSTLNSLRMFC